VVILLLDAKADVEVVGAVRDEMFILNLPIFSYLNYDMKLLRYDN
jgi:hypothetical protein